MRRVLLVSYYFPPRYSVGGKRPYGFARHLPEHGFRATVLTAPTAPDEPLDPSFSDADLAAYDVRRAYYSDRELARRPRRNLGSDGTIAAPTEPWRRARAPRGLSRLRAELRLVPVIGPDAGLIPVLAYRIARLAAEVGACAIVATAPPWEPVLAAAVAARAIGLPLVADLRDPWSFNPAMQRRPAWARAATGLLERWLFRAAAAITVTTEATRDEYALLAPDARVVCVRTGFDDAPVTPRHDDAVTLVHFGNCYGERSLAPFLRALAITAKRRAPGPRIRLLNLGRVSRVDLDLAAELGIAARFEHRTVLPYAEGLSLVAGADLALLPSFGAEPWFIPGKLYDYLRARVPILAASASPEIARLLEATRLGWTHPAGDAEALARRIDDAIEARAAGRRLVDPDQAALAALTTRATTGALAALIERVIKESSGTGESSKGSSSERLGL